jgi:N-acyl-L-homoserine lactone synthetase
MPPGAKVFGSRQAWQVAYSSQFQSRHDRALTKAQSIRSKIGGPERAEIDEFDPPKPKWMRWRTYERLIGRSRRLEAIADLRLLFFMKQWAKRS